MLTQTDIDWIEKLLREKFKEELKNIPTKNEFFGKIDEIMGELKIIRKEQAVFCYY